MSDAGDLINRLEEETGQHTEDNNGINPVMAEILSAMSQYMPETSSIVQKSDSEIIKELIDFWAYQLENIRDDRI